jgi:sugar fermentation stimulation protein A
MASTANKNPLMEIKNRQKCRIIQRLNRFAVEIAVGEKKYQAHINNTGRLTEFLVTDKTAFCYPMPATAKTDFRLFAVEDRGLGALIDTQLQMRCFEAAFRQRYIPWLQDCVFIKRNPRLNTSVMDYEFRCHGETVLCEVKSAVLRDGSTAMYPDCPTVRGQRHIEELTAYVNKGGRSVIVFIAALPGVDTFKPYRDADPVIYANLKKAESAGVEIHALNMYFDPHEGWIHLHNVSLSVKI